MIPVSDWLSSFFITAEADTQVLQRNGAECQAEARADLLQQLKAASCHADDETLTVEQVVALTGVNAETVRRAVRRGDVPDTRTSKKQTIRIRKADVSRIAAKKRARLPRVAAPAVVTPIDRFAGM